MSLNSVLLLGAILFAIGLYGVMVKRNVITILMCLELMFSGVILSAVAFSRYIPIELSSESNTSFILDGQIFALFIMAVVAAETTVGVALIICVYRESKNLFSSDISNLQN